MEREVLESLGGRYAGNKRSFLALAPHQMMQRDMVSEIHEVERVSYCDVLRAFKAQSDALTWEKESLITELRKELRISDDEHRQLLAEVNADDLVRAIREWREGRGHQNVATNGLRHANNHVTGPTVSSARKRPRLSISGNPLGGGTPSHSFLRQGPTSGTGRGRSNAGQPLFTLEKHMQYQLTNHVSFGGPVDDPPESIIGRRVMIRWPSSNNFCEAVIAAYDPVDGRHSLVYDGNTRNTTMEWVHINEVPREDIRWVGEDSLPFLIGEDCVPNPGRGRALSMKNQFANDIQPSGNDVKKDLGVIEIFHTGSLIKKVEKLLDASDPDELRFKKAKKLLKDHEHSLVQVIAKLAEACDNDGEHLFAHGLSSGRQRRVDYHEAVIADRSDIYELSRG